MTKHIDIVAHQVKFFVMALLVATVMSTQLFAPSASAVTPHYCENKIVKQGSKHKCVKYAKQILNGISKTHAGDTDNGYTITASQLKVNTTFNAAMTKKVRTFQGWSGIAVDGKVGGYTWIYLCSFAQYDYKYVPNSTTKTAYQAGINAGCVY